MTVLRTFVLSIFLMVSLVSTPALAGSLDGKTFSGKEGHIGKEALGDDTVVFENGKFISNGCKEWGFSGGDYTTTVDGDKVHFVADTYSEKYGRITWTGTVAGDHIDATYIWYDKGKYSKPEQVKWFSGDIQ
jgi:hypothetical protein